MAASGSGGNESGGRAWTATSTWVPGPAGGAVEDAVSFETTEDDAEASPAGVVLCHPPAGSDGDVDHPCPCEVTVSFRGKYEIHRVYVRSTARIYELYHSPDAKGTSKDYLCTVRCGLAVKEPQPCGEDSMSEWTGSALNSDKREHEAKSVSSGSDEDSWVDVKIPESPGGNKTPESQERNAIRACQENTLAHYEATAEMTDVNPCVSLTIRFLSLQSKTSVHIEEIYIFADPVESTNDVSIGGPGNMGGSSLLAMLVPGLMQMSKSRNLKIDDSYFSDGSRNQESSTCERVTQEAGLCSTNDSKYMSAGVESRMRPTVGVTVSDEKSSQGEFQLKDPGSLPLPVQTLESTQAPSVKDQRELNTGHLANPLINENFTPYNHIERKLDTLLSKVEKMELYCSRFEDSMIKPLGSIEARLQRLEEQFSSFSVDIQSLKGSSAFRSAPDGMSNTMSSQKEAHSDANDNSTSTTVRKPGLAVRVPDFISDDSCGYVVPSLFVKVSDFIAQRELTDAKLHDGSASEKERKTSPGLVIKVPEFPDDEGEDDDDDGDDKSDGGEDNDYDNDEVEEKKQAEVCGDGDDHLWSDDTLRKSTAGDTKSKKPVSINGALASALEALLISTKGTSTSKPAACTTCDLGAENINDSFSCSLSPEKTGEMSTNDGSADQFLGTSDDTNLVGAILSSQDIDTTPNDSLSKEMLDSKVKKNEQNDDLSIEKVAFAAITEPLDVPSLTDTIEECIDDGSRVNRQNNGANVDTMPYVVNCESLDPPKPPTLFEPVDSGVQVNENRPSISLVEFLAARNVSSCKNGTSEACHDNGDAEKLSLERESATAGKIPQNISQLLVKKALEVDVDERNLLSSIPIGAKFEGPSSLASRTSGHDINNTKEAVSDVECGLKDTENGFRLSSISSQYHATDSQRKMIKNSSLDWSLDESFSEQDGEHSWSGLSTMESFSGAPAREPVVSGNYVEELAGIADCPVATLISVEELQKVSDDLLYEFKDDLLGMTSTAKGTNKSSTSLEVLLAESSDSEAQISDLEGIDSGAGIGSTRLFSTFSSSDDDACALDEPLVDVADLTTPSEPYTSALNEPLFDVYVPDLTNPSGIDATSVNEPSADVVDLPHNFKRASVNEPSADVVDLPHTSNEPLASLGDLPKPPEMSFGGNSGEHSDSLI